MTHMRTGRDVTFYLAEGRMEVHDTFSEDWSVTLVETGHNTQTGGRLKRVQRYLEGEELFYMTYGDGLSDIDISALTTFARANDKLATVTAVQPAGRFGALDMKGDAVNSFREKPEGEGWMSGGFFVLKPQVMDYIDGDSVPWEKAPMERIASEGELVAYKHQGFWQPVDTLRDKNQVEEAWQSGTPPWRVWT